MVEPLLELAAGARFVLLGEASHGTHEFYSQRASITRRLIEDHGFTAVAAEADWPDAYRVNAYVRGAGDDADAEEALSGFRRFPHWMWRNQDVLEFVEWLREWNDARPAGARKTGFYGLDLYSLHASMEAVVRYLDEVDSEGARRARNRYACFDHFGPDPQSYAYAAGLGGEDPCEDEAVAQLLDLRRRPPERSTLDEDGRFYAEQNARVVVRAEEYYRSMFRGRVLSWNLRDTHMAETLEALAAHLGPGTKTAVWAHNSHLGDARATELGRAGELNLGQLVRERHGGDALLVGFTTYSGTVTAASDWDRPAELKRVRPALPESWEALFHERGGDRLVLLRGSEGEPYRGARLERAIGVIYRPETERLSHYFHARLADQFDAVIHVDETSAVEELEPAAEPVREEAPETFPSAL